MSQQDVAAVAVVLREFATTLIRNAPSPSLSRVATSTLADLDRLGSQRITTLADRQLVSQPAMTGLVQRLEGAGLAHRLSDPEDGRASLIVITDEGRAALAERRRLQDEAIAATIRTLDPADLDALVHALPALTHLTENHAVN